MGKRGCGSRKVNALYSVLPSGRRGFMLGAKPLSHFLIDPPIKPDVKFQAIGVSVVPFEVDAEAVGWKTKGHFEFSDGGMIDTLNLDAPEDSYIEALRKHVYSLLPDATVNVGQNGCYAEFPASASDYVRSRIEFTLIKGYKTFHIFDVVGKKFYPYACDFIEEVRHYTGSPVAASRRLPNNDSLKYLSLDSKHFLLHARARVANYEDFQVDGERAWSCPCRQKDKHDPCLGLTYQAIDGKQLWPESSNEGSRRIVKRIFPNNEEPIFSYMGKMPPEGVEPKFEMGIFMWFPLSVQAVIGSLETLSEKIVSAKEKLEEQGVAFEYAEE